MTFSHYSAEENNTQCKLAIMMTLQSATATSPKNNDFFQQNGIDCKVIFTLSLPSYRQLT